MTMHPDRPSYRALLDQYEPRILHTEEDNQRATERMYELDQIQEPSPEQKDMTELLLLLIERFEEEHYALSPASPLEVVEFLLDQKGLSREHLAVALGGPMRLRAS